MSLTRIGEENEADTHSIDGAWTAGILSKAKLHQQGPGSKRKRSNDHNRLKSGIPTTKHRIYQRTKRIGNREKQYANILSGDRRLYEDGLGEWPRDAKNGSNQVKAGTNHVLQGVKDLTATECQFISNFGLETANSPLKYEIKIIKLTHCIIYCKYCIQTGKKIYKKNGYGSAVIPLQYRYIQYNEQESMRI